VALVVVVVVMEESGNAQYNTTSITIQQPPANSCELLIQSDHALLPPGSVLFANRSVVVML
jgi:hypothetical protein